MPPVWAGHTSKLKVNERNMVAPDNSLGPHEFREVKCDQLHERCARCGADLSDCSLQCERHFRRIAPVLPCRIAARTDDLAARCIGIS